MSRPLEEIVDEVVGGLEALVATYHAGAEHKGCWQNCRYAPCVPVRHYAEVLRDARLTAANDPSPGERHHE